uniref:HDC09438 n=1 Tax=Drosophila melanogaster TaxID=7227 RepID=Q6ILH6_DROME|nr:TPA_inf: HDC09438 [Drosophila melanogaster]
MYFIYGPHVCGKVHQKVVTGWRNLDAVLSTWSNYARNTFKAARPLQHVAIVAAAAAAAAAAVAVAVTAAVAAAADVVTVAGHCLALNLRFLTLLIGLATQGGEGCCTPKEGHLGHCRSTTNEQYHPDAGFLRARPQGECFDYATDAACRLWTVSFA